MIRSFRNDAGILTAWGCAESNGDDIARDEPDDFALEPGQWRLVDGEWIAYSSPPEVPTTVSPAQAQLALLNAGLLDQVESVVTAADRTTQIAWKSATSIERGSPTVAELAGALNLTPQQVDDLFIAAAAIRI